VVCGWLLLASSERRMGRTSHHLRGLGKSLAHVGVVDLAFSACTVWLHLD
jgi:hypothetical protein